MKDCPHCGKRLVPLKFNRWKIIEREHSRHQRYEFKKFRAHALVNAEGRMFGYVIEELEVKQEFFCIYEGDESHAVSVGTVSRTLKEAKAKLKERGSA